MRRQYLYQLTNQKTVLIQADQSDDSIHLVVIGVEAHPVQSNGRTQHGVSDAETLTDGQGLRTNQRLVVI